MAFYRGQEGSVKFDDAGTTAAAITSTRAWTLSVEKEALDTTSHGATYRANVGGIISGSGTIEVLYDAPGSGDKLDLIKEVNTATDPANANVELYLDETGTKKISGDILVTSAEYSATVGELEVITINFVTNGTITLGI